MTENKEISIFKRIVANEFNSSNTISIFEEFIAFYLDYSLDEVRDNLRIMLRKKDNDLTEKLDFFLIYEDEDKNIEIANTARKEDIEINLCYACEVHGNQQPPNVDIDDSVVRETTQIMFYNYDNQERLNGTYYLTDKEEENKYEKFRICTINLFKVLNMDYTNDPKIDGIIDWCKLFTETDIGKFNEIAEKILVPETAQVLKERANKLNENKEFN